MVNKTSAAFYFACVNGLFNLKKSSFLSFFTGYFFLLQLLLLFFLPLVILTYTGGFASFLHVSGKQIIETSKTNFVMLSS